MRLHDRVAVSSRLALAPPSGYALAMCGRRGAAANSEDLNLVASLAVAAAYAAHWLNRLAVSVRFERRGEWGAGSR